MDELRELRGTIKSLQDTIAKLGPIEKRDSAYPNGNGNGATAKTGRVVLVNFYNDELLFIINGNRYRLGPHAHAWSRMFRLARSAMKFSPTVGAFWKIASPLLPPATRSR